MGMLIGSEEKIKELELLQSGLKVTDGPRMDSYSCDCTGCSNGCFEFCADGHGPTD
ncbi:hypothetical protein SAMN06297422_101112 [Lachnospiraceae bacterium]|nr:hypothetical protein SAMN06297422_101112 [Lachnospiraceae bacterium]